MNKDIQFILQEKYNGDDSSWEFKCDVDNYNKGMPVGYIIGNVPFLDCVIDLEYKTLIPRPETEYWVEKIIQTIPENFDGEVCDIFSGSGCIGIAIAKYRPKAKITFIDNQVNSIRQIHKNIKINHIKSKVEVVQSDMFLNISKTKKFNYILVNPPYISKDSENIEKSVLEYEPHTALFAENEGMAFIQKTIEQAKNYLEKDGYLIIEHSPEQAEKIHRIAEKQGYINIQTNKDQYDIERYSIIEV